MGFSFGRTGKSTARYKILPMTKLPAYFILLLATGIFISCKRIKRNVIYDNYTLDNTVSERVYNKLFKFKVSHIYVQDYILFEQDLATGKLVKNETKGIESWIGGASHDTSIVLSFFAGALPEFGCNLWLYRDRSNINAFIRADSAVYKILKTDTLASEIMIHKKFFTLALANKPAFQNEELVEGIFELTTADFYKVSGGREKKCHLQLKAYFSLSTLPKLNMPE